MSNKIYLLERQLLGAVAHCAVRQSPYHRPDDLEKVLDEYHSIVEPIFATAPLKVLELTDDELNQLIKKLRQIPEYEAWNERKNGNQAEYKFTSHYDTDDNPDDDFIDLDALEGNVFNICAEEQL